MKIRWPWSAKYNSDVKKHRERSKRLVLIVCTVALISKWFCLCCSHNIMFGVTRKSLSLCVSYVFHVSLHSSSVLSFATSGEETGCCFTITYIMPMNVHLTSESTVNMLSKYCKWVSKTSQFPGERIQLALFFPVFFMKNDSWKGAQRLGWDLQFLLK